MEDKERAANQQEIEHLRKDIDHLKGEVLDVEKLYKAEIDAHQETREKLDAIKEICAG